MSHKFTFVRSTLCWVFIFLLVFSEPAQAASPNSPAATVGPALSVDVTANRKAISPYIYGLNFAKESFANEIDLPVRRWGGNTTSRYNWQNGNANSAQDWYYENSTMTDAYNWSVNQNHNGWIAQNERTATDSLITIPMLGYVAKDATSCGFNTDVYGAQQDTDTWRPKCGNGYHTDGSPIVGNNPLDASVAVNETFMKNWVANMVTNHGGANAGGVKFYNLDNEPELWSETHRDVHPVAESYDELYNKTVAYAAAIKQADPNAKTFGYTSYGWTGYWYSQKDANTAASLGYNCPTVATCYPDYASHGNLYQAQWYLSQMKQYEQTNSIRLLDYLDLHYYQEGGPSLVTAGSAALQAQRLRSTRSLWDPTYIDESWIGDPSQPADWRAVRLIPRMHAWVNTYYPGTKLAITEYNWGGLESMNGALVQADVLGIFGREGLDLATLWNYPIPGSDPLGYDNFETLPGAYAFRMYRNYDGAGRKFGDVAVKATSGNQGLLSIYAAQRTSDGALTLMVINKTAGTLTSSVALTHFVPGLTAKVYRYSPANLSAIVKQADQAVTTAGFSATFPANSITLFVIPKQNVVNGGFNVYSGTSLIPSNWTAANFAGTDGKDTTTKKEGFASVRINGASGKTKTLTQTIMLSGAAGNTLTFSFWVSGSVIPTTPTAELCQGQVTLYNGSILVTNKIVSCATGTYAFQKKSVTFNATGAYTKAVIKFTYSKASGKVWFDWVSLLK